MQATDQTTTRERFPMAQLREIKPALPSGRFQVVAWCYVPRGEKTRRYEINRDGTPEVIGRGNTIESAWSAAAETARRHR